MRKGMSSIGYVILAVLILVGLIAGGYALKAGMISLGITQQMSQIDSAGQIIDKTYNADNAIYNYEWFKSQFEKIKATELQIDNTKMENLVGFPESIDAKKLIYFSYFFR